MPGLTKAQVDEFLAGPVIARLATVQPSGAPYLVPVWQYWDRASMFIIPRAKSRFVAFLKKEPRVAVSCADDLHPEHSRVLIEGAAEVVEGPALMHGRMLEIAREMAERYGGADGLTYLEGTMNEPRYLLRVSPRKITSWTGGWKSRYRTARS